MTKANEKEWQNRCGNLSVNIFNLPLKTILELLNMPKVRLGKFTNLIDAAKASEAALNKVDKRWVDVLKQFGLIPWPKNQDKTNQQLSGGCKEAVPILNLAELYGRYLVRQAGVESLKNLVEFEEGKLILHRGLTRYISSKQLSPLEQEALRFIVCRYNLKIIMCYADCDEHHNLKTKLQELFIIKSKIAFCFKKPS